MKFSHPPILWLSALRRLAMAGVLAALLLALRYWAVQP